MLVFNMPTSIRGKCTKGDGHADFLVSLIAAADDANVNDLDSDDDDDGGDGNGNVLCVGVVLVCWYVGVGAAWRCCSHCYCDFESVFPVISGACYTRELTLRVAHCGADYRAMSEWHSIA